MTDPGTPFVSPDDLAGITPLWEQAVEEQLLPVVAEVYQDSAGTLHAQLIDATDLPSVPPVTSLASEAYLAQATNTFTEVGADLWETARGELLDGMQAGESIPQLRDRLRTSAGLTGRTATLVARTQVLDAANAGSYDTARVSGLDLLKGWEATPDARTRDTHAAAGAFYQGDGMIALTAPFTVGGFQCERPHDPVLPPAERYNCRCALVYAMPPVVPTPPVDRQAELEAWHQQRVAQIRAAHEARVAEIARRHEQRLADLAGGNEAAVEAIQVRHAARLAKLNAAYEARRAALAAERERRLGEVIARGPSPLGSRPLPAEPDYMRRLTVLEQKAARPVLSEQPLSGGMSAETRLRMTDSGQYVTKQYGVRFAMDEDELRHNIDAEIIGPQVMEAVGGRAALVSQISDDTIAVEFVEGRAGVALTEAEIRALADTPQGRLMGLVDYLTGNGDRFEENFIVTPGNVLVSIDQSGAFSPALAELDRVPGGILSRYLHDGDYRLADTIDWSAADLSTMRQRLEGLRPIFVERDRQAWFDEMMLRMGLLEQRAMRRPMPSAVAPPPAPGVPPAGPVAVPVRPALLEADTVRQVQAVFLREWAAIDRHHGSDRHPSARFIPDGDVQTAREHAEGLLRTIERFPRVPVAVSHRNIRHYAQLAADDPVVQFGNGWARDRAAYLRSLVEGAVPDAAGVAWHPAAIASPQGVAMHEFGHALHRMLSPLEQDLSVAVPVFRYSTKVDDAVKAIVRELAAERGLPADELVKREIGEYAASNTSELIGEAFADAMVRGEGASVLSRRIMQVLVDEYDRATVRPGRAGGVPLPTGPVPSPWEAVDLPTLRRLAADAGVPNAARLGRARLAASLDERGITPPIVPTGPVGRLATVHLREGASMESSTWRAERIEDFDGPQDGVLTAITSYVRRPGFVNTRLRTPVPDTNLTNPNAWKTWLHEASLDELMGRGPFNIAAEEAARKRADRLIAALDRIMDRSRTSRALTVYRGAGLDDLHLPPPGQATGFTWTDAGFVSTSESRSVAAGSFGSGTGRVTLDIRLPPGTPALRIEGLGEDELLLGRGLAFRVLEDRRTTDGRLIVEVIPAEAPPAAATMDPLARIVAETLHQIDQGADLPTIITTLTSNPAAREVLTAARRAKDPARLATSLRGLAGRRNLTLPTPAQLRALAVAERRASRAAAAEAARAARAEKARLAEAKRQVKAVEGGDFQSLRHVGWRDYEGPDGSSWVVVEFPTEQAAREQALAAALRNLVREDRDPGLAAIVVGRGAAGMRGWQVAYRGDYPGDVSLDDWIAAPVDRLRRRLTPAKIKSTAARYGFDEDYAASLITQRAQVLKPAFSPSAIRSMHRLDDSVSGMKARVTALSRDHDFGEVDERFTSWLQVDVHISTRTDDLGYATILVSPTGREVYYAALALDAPVQGQGFVTRLMIEMFERYRAAGVKTLGIRANADVGGYAWARAGFTFLDDDARREFAAYARAYAAGKDVDWYAPGHILSTTRRAKLDPEIAAALRRVADDPTAEPIDYAMIGHLGGSKMWPGKEFMLGSAWRGKMDL